MKYFHLPLLLCIAISALLFCSCKEGSSFVISLHDFADDSLISSTRLNREVMVQGFNKSKKINYAAFADSRCFYKIEVVPSEKKPSRYGLRLLLDEFGTHQMLQAASGRDGYPFAIIIDGFYVGDGYFNMADIEKGYVDLPPLWSEVEALNIASNAEDNYVEITPWD